MTTRDSLRFLAAHLRERMADLGMQTQADVRLAGGPAEASLRAIFAGGERQGAIRTPQSDTLHKLDVAMQWEPGSAREAMMGQTPRPQGQQRTVGLTGTTDEGEPFYIRLPAATLESLSEPERAEAEAAALKAALATIREIRQARQSER